MACAPSSDDQSLVARDEKLLQQLASLQKQWEQKQVTQTEFVAGLRVLEKREAVLFQQVRQHHFKDMTAANRFYRWRMKFPSPIVEAQRTTLPSHR